MNIGYACITAGNITSNYRTITKKYLTEEKLIEVVEHNLNTLEEIIDYNILNNIKLFRITSDLIPFGSSPLNTISWENIFFNRFIKIGEKIRNAGIRVSMHPGQYTIINSPRDNVIENSIEDLIYHNKILDLLGSDNKSKIILHIGGVYDDKDNAKKRFIENYNRLSDDIKNRLVIENDHNSYNIIDVLDISSKCDIPVVFDNLHHDINKEIDGKSDYYWITQTQKTWTSKDGLQKIHYSQQDIGKTPGAHSNTINLRIFKEYLDANIINDLDIMLEVKDKNLSAIKINNLVNNSHISDLEIEWSKYKYNILEKSPESYNSIRQLLKDKESYPIFDFYDLIDIGLGTQSSIGNKINGIEHVWGYFKKSATEKEKEEYKRLLNKLKEDVKYEKRIKKYLFAMANKYNEKYLLNSYYFLI